MVASVSMAMNGCALTGPVAPSTHSPYRFGYEIKKTHNIGVVNAFDDGRQIIVQFNRDIPAFITASDDRGDYIPVNPRGSYLSIEKMVSRVRLTTREGQWVEIVSPPSLSAPVVSTMTAAAPQMHTNAEAYQARSVAAAARDESTVHELEEARAALIAAQAEIARLKVLVEAETKRTSNDVQRSSLAAAANDLKVVESKINGLQARIVRIPFAWGRSALMLSDADTAALIELAKAAVHINLRGRTDSVTADEPNRRIALERATRTRAMFVKHGVPAEKIRVYSMAAGGFIADNNTSAGQAENRRVDIEFLQNAESVKTAQN